MSLGDRGGGGISYRHGLLVSLVAIPDPHSENNFSEGKLPDLFSPNNYQILLS